MKIRSVTDFSTNVFEGAAQSIAAGQPARPMSRLRMGGEELLKGEAYDPNKLLDALLEKLNLKNDAALSRHLEVAPPLISKVRHRKLPLGAALLLCMHEVSEISIRDMRDLMGDRRGKFRVSSAVTKQVN